MKTITISIDEKLLSEIDQSRAAKELGRSAVFRHAAIEYLARERQAAIAEQYAHAYADEAGLGREFDGWEAEGKWPAE
jgi:metal-responsive CopG/Arc/MetJ family transcriptional regulator